jgi:transposase
MQTVTTIGLDIAKSVFQVHGIDAEGKVLIRRKLKRRYVLPSSFWDRPLPTREWHKHLSNLPKPRP